MKPLDLKEDEKNCVLNILKQYVSEYPVYVFGSRATGTAKPFSDLDLVIVSENAINALILYHLHHEFAESSLPFKVDILDWSSLSQEFKDHIQREWIKISTWK